jgi:hypothetical protein
MLHCGAIAGGGASIVPRDCFCLREKGGEKVDRVAMAADGS